MLLKKFSVVILAAGKGSRMLSDVPKVMHKIGGKYMLQHLIDTVVKVRGVRSVYIVCNDNFSIIRDNINIDVCHHIFVHWVLQKELLGTGNALQTALSLIHDDKEEILVLYGDVPLISCETLQKLYLVKSECDISLLTAVLDNPVGYGRIIRHKKGNITSIIEDDMIVHHSSDYETIKEVSTGIFVALSGHLKCWLKTLIIHNLRNEFYLTDIVSIAYRTGYSIQAIQPVIDIFEILGVNNKSDLIYLDRKYQERQAQYLLSMGVMILDPNRFDLRGTLICGKDVCIDINVVIEGHVSLGDRVRIESSCILRDTIMGNDVIIHPFSIIENAKVRDYSIVGPFARLRENVALEERSCIGNFVELKNVRLGKCSKVKHLSYLGDADIGSQVNIGAGTIICNYDGVNKHYTNIKDNVCVGADSQLLAPLNIGKNAIVGAGTTVTKDVSDGDTVISRIRQFSILKQNKKV